MEAYTGGCHSFPLDGVRDSHCNKVAFEQRPEGRERWVILTWGKTILGRDSRGRISEVGAGLARRSSRKEIPRDEQGGQARPHSRVWAFAPSESETVRRETLELRRVRWGGTWPRSTRNKTKQNTWLLSRKETQQQQKQKLGGHFGMFFNNSGQEMKSEAADSSGKMRTTNWPLDFAVGKPWGCDQGREGGEDKAWLEWVRKKMGEERIDTLPSGREWGSNSRRS